MGDMAELTCSICGEEILGVLVFVGEAEDWVCDRCSGVTESDF
jgi:ribosome-binding protein aMBF1 (putative translation factor)